MIQDAEYYRQYRIENPGKSTASSRKWQTANPKEWAYIKQKSHAKARGIEFKLTQSEWIEWWGLDFDNRGRGPGKLVMARCHDEGPYELGNIQKLTQEENTREYLERRYE